MTCRKRNMQGIYRGTLGQTSRLDQLARERSSLIRDAQGWNALHPLSPPARGINVASCGLGYHDLRYVHSELGPTTAPPLVRDLLPGGSDQIAAWMGREIADD